MKRRHLLTVAGASTSLFLARQKSTLAQSSPESSSLADAVNSAISELEFNYVAISDLKVIGLGQEVAIALITLRQADSVTSSLTGTSTLVVRTSDGGENWNLTLKADQGSVVINESFFLKDSKDRVNNIWLVTQWQIAGTFPTVYATKDGGQTWSESSAVRDFLNSKGHIFNYAEGIRFRNEAEGIIVARATEEKGKIYFLQTENGGETWQEIATIPNWYFEVVNYDWQTNNPWLVEQQNGSISISKQVASLGTVLRGS